jgi:FtsZ-binding cell division protein ZapB
MEISSGDTEAIQNENDELRKENDELRKENDDIRKENGDIRKEVDRLRLVEQKVGCRHGHLKQFVEGQGGPCALGYPGCLCMEEIFLFMNRWG